MVLVERKRKGVLVKEKCMVLHAKLEMGALPTEEILISPSKPMVKCCEKESTRQVAAPDHLSKIRLQATLQFILSIPAAL